MIVVVMGVSGSGKSTVGGLLAARLGCRFLDADDFHPPENVAKMAGGTALEDADRWQWLARLNLELRAADARGESAVLACSALKCAYRERLAAGLARCEFALLEGSVELIRGRLRQRRGHYMPAALLESQFAALERPAHAIIVDIAAPPQACAEAILERIQKRPRSL